MKDTSDGDNNAYDERKKEFSLCTREILIKHDKKVLEPVGKYHSNSFEDEKGDCTNLRQMAEEVQIFDPIF